MMPILSIDFNYLYTVDIIQFNNTSLYWNSIQIRKLYINYIYFLRCVTIFFLMFDKWLVLQKQRITTITYSLLKVFQLDSSFFFLRFTLMSAR